MDDSEVDALLRRLLEHSTGTRFVYCHDWPEGDIVIWDAVAPSTGHVHGRRIRYGRWRGRRLQAMALTRGRCCDLNWPSPNPLFMCAPQLKSGPHTLGGSGVCLFAKVVGKIYDW